MTANLQPPPLRKVFIPTISFFVGVVFSIGLALGGMTDPSKVIGFLDISGPWNPSLMFVMGGAIPVYMVTWFLIRRRKQPLADTSWHYPTNQKIDARLVIGAAIFGVGWGIGGICPGPAIASLGAGARPAVVFMLASAAGSWLASKVNAKP